MMNSRADMNLAKGRERGQAPLRQAWIDRDGKLISFHPIDSGQLMEAEDSAFWEKVISLSHTGYRVQ